MALAGADQLGADLAVQVIITDSQEALEAARRLFPALHSVYLNGDAGDIDIFAGRKIVLMPTAGREQPARALADVLVRIAAEVKICPPEADRAPGWSIAAEAGWADRTSVAGIRVNVATRRAMVEQVIEPLVPARAR